MFLASGYSMYYIRMLFLIRDKQMNDEFLTIKEVAEKWGVTPRRVQRMCADGKIPGAKKFGRDWAIPTSTEKPVDGRIKTGEYTNWRRQQKDKTREEI